MTNGGRRSICYDLQLVAGVPRELTVVMSDGHLSRNNVHLP